MRGRGGEPRIARMLLIEPLPIRARQGGTTCRGRTRKELRGRTWKEHAAEERGRLRGRTRIAGWICILVMLWKASRDTWMTRFLHAIVERRSRRGCGSLLTLPYIRVYPRCIPRSSASPCFQHSFRGPTWSHHRFHPWNIRGLRGAKRPATAPRPPRPWRSPRTAFRPLSDTSSGSRTRPGRGRDPSAPGHPWRRGPAASARRR